MSNKDAATPDEIKSKVQEAYARAISNRNTQWSHSSTIDPLFRGLTLYGHDAGIDFVDTHLREFVREAVAAAGCKLASIRIEIYGCGSAALAAMASRLAELTGLKVNAERSALTLAWADNAPRML